MTPADSKELLLLDPNVISFAPQSLTTEKTTLIVDGPQAEPLVDFLKE